MKGGRVDFLRGRFWGKGRQVAASPLRRAFKTAFDAHKTVESVMKAMQQPSGTVKIVKKAGAKMCNRTLCLN